MRLLKRAIQVVILVAASNWLFESIIALIPLGISQESVLVGIAVLWAAFLWVNIWPLFGPWPTERVRQLSYGCELLTLFWISAAIDLVLVPVVTPAFFGDHPESTETFLWLIWLLFLVVMEAAVYWNGMIRVCVFSRRLERRQKIRTALVGWIPIFNIWYLRRIIRMVSDEAALELLRADLEGPDK